MTTETYDSLLSKVQPELIKGFSRFCESMDPKSYLATAAAVADPQKNMEARERRVAILHTTA